MLELQRTAELGHARAWGGRAGAKTLTQPDGQRGGGSGMRCLCRRCSRWCAKDVDAHQVHAI